MTRKTSFICALSMFISTGFAPLVSQADPVDITMLDTEALRALFHSRPFNDVCPLDVYDGDYSQTEMIRSSALTPNQSLETKPSAGYSDGLEDYGESFASAELSHVNNPSK